MPLNTRYGTQTSRASSLQSSVGITFSRRPSPPASFYPHGEWLLSHRRGSLRQTASTCRDWPICPASSAPALTPQRRAGIFTRLRVSLSCAHDEVSGIPSPCFFGQGVARGGGVFNR